MQLNINIYNIYEGKKYTIFTKYTYIFFIYKVFKSLFYGCKVQGYCVICL